MAVTKRKYPTRLRDIWYQMLYRCNNPNCKAYYRYGGRGITVCREWADFEVFAEWAMANGYDKKLSIDRIDNDGNYCPKNCRWATPVQQCNNKSNNKYITVGNERVTAQEVAQLLGISYDRVRRRLHYIKYTESEVAKKFNMKISEFIVKFYVFVSKKRKFDKKF